MTDSLAIVSGWVGFANCLMLHLRESPAEGTAQE
jgi:hypothetical protein